MVQQCNQVRREQNGRYLGFRINCEQVPMLPAWVVRRVWDDPRDIPHLFSWIGRQDGQTKDQVRIYRNPPGSDPSGRDSVEIMRTHATMLQVFIEWRRQPKGGRNLLLRCTECYRPCRTLYGLKVGDDGRYYVVRQANWECRRCAGLRYSSEGGALLWRASVLTNALMRPCADVRFPRPPLWLPNETQTDRKSVG